MVQIRYVFLFSISLILVSSQIYAVKIFKSMDHTGAIVFSDKPMPGTHHQEVVELQDFDNSAIFSNTHTPSEQLKAAKINTPPTAITAREAPSLATVPGHKIPPLEEKILQQLAEARAFYQAVQNHQRRSPSISAADDKYREQLVEAMRVRITRLETQLHEVQHTTAFNNVNAPEFSISAEKSSLPLTQNEIQKLQQFFPDRLTNHNSE